MPVTINGTSGFTFPNGTQSTPAFTGVDTDTGIFFASDTVSISTAGTQKLTVTSSGLVGINTTVAPQGEKLVVDSVGGTAYNTAFMNSSTDSTTYAASTWRHGQTGTALGYVGVGGTNVNNSSFRGTFVVGTQNATSLVLNTNDAERLRIISSGNVGIGTTSPESILEICGTQNSHTSSLTVGPLLATNITNNFDTVGTQTVLTLYRYGKISSSYSNTVNFNIGRYSQSAGTQSRTRLTLRLSEGNTNDPDSDVLTLLGNGNVGIGTTNPSNKFHLYHNVASDCTLFETNQSFVTLTFKSTSNTSLPTIGINSSGELEFDQKDTTKNIKFGFGGQGTKVTIKPDGNVGIGTTNPTSTLDIRGNTRISFASSLAFARDNTNTDYSSYITTTNNPDGGYSGTTATNYWMEIGSPGGTHIVLNTDGSQSAGRNLHDHFTIWQYRNNSSTGKRLFSVDNVGNVQFGAAGVRLDRAWDNYPGINVQVNNNDGVTNQAEFRFHGFIETHASWVGGATGTDFSVYVRSDGGGNASDRRQKTDISTITNALDTICQLRGVTYTGVNRELTPQTHMSMANGQRVGFIAQEVIPVLPQLVKYAGETEQLENGWASQYSIDYGSLVAVLTEAVKELKEKNDSLELRIAALE